MASFVVHFEIVEKIYITEQFATFHQNPCRYTCTLRMLVMKLIDLNFHIYIQHVQCAGVIQPVLIKYVTSIEL